MREELSPRDKRDVNYSEQIVALSGKISELNINISGDQERLANEELSPKMIDIIKRRISSREAQKDAVVDIRSQYNWVQHIGETTIEEIQLEFQSVFNKTDKETLINAFKYAKLHLLTLAIGIDTYHLRRANGYAVNDDFEYIIKEFNRLNGYLKNRLNEHGVKENDLKEKK